LISQSRRLTGCSRLTEEETDEAEATPDEEHLGSKICVARAGIDKVWSRVGNGPIEEPIGGSRHGERFGPDLQWENLAGDHPSARAPRTSEEENVDADEGDEGILAGLVSESYTGSDASHNELADGHSRSAEEK
jgi:hypothetical protein